MKRGRRSGHALYAALATAALLTTGCLTSTPQIHQVAQGLERSMPGTRFEREGGVKLGRLSLHVIRWAGSRSESQEAESLDAKSHDAESHDEAGEAG